MTVGGAQTGAEFITLNAVLCTPVCLTMLDGRSVYADNDHLSVFGARTVIAPLLQTRMSLSGEGQP